ncbi:GxxExxY protein [Gemmatimonas sp.]|uniref:GxxExxY protein n=1 Tax=Gemmatimonas sp. TaxID=1962908 RepID=UPI0025C284E1|nr:GxxExxY protein [Gemmatimonas sp.]
MLTPHAVMNDVLDVAIEVHRELGPGLLESAYEAIIADELLTRGHIVQRQLVVPIRFKERTYDRGYRLDLLVDHLVVVEIKSAERHAPIFEQQVLTYLRGLGLRHGMVVNLGLSRAIDGVNRVTNYRVSEHDDGANSRLRAEQPQQTEPLNQ